FEAVLAGGRDEPAEVLERAELGVHRPMPAFLGPDGPGAADVRGPGALGVVAPLAVRAPDRVNRRQIDHVEAHLGRRLEASLAVAQPAVTFGVVGAGARKELVPGAEAG